MADETLSFTRKVLIAVGVPAALLALVFLFVQAISVFMLLFAATLLALLLSGLSDQLRSLTGLPSGWSLAVVIVLLLVLIGAAATFLGPRIAAQFDQLADTLPQSIERLRGVVRQYQWGSTLLAYTPSPAEAVRTPGNVVAGITGAASTTVGWIGTFFLLVFIGVFLAAQPRFYVAGFLRLVPPARQARAREILHRLGHTLKLWLLGRLLAMTVVGTITAVGLLLLDVPLALTLGVIAGLLDFVPTIGPAVAAIPALLLALMQDPATVLWVGLLYVGVQSFEGYLLTPLIQHRIAAVPPALILATQILLGYLIGLLGLLLATPFLILAMVLVQELYVRGVLGQREA